MTMKVGDDQVSFSWRNYTRPTPANLERFASFIRDTLAATTAINVIAEAAPEWVNAVLAFGIILTGQLVKFFSSVVQEERSKTQNPTA